ncbi:MAG: UvrB/UvrC protein [Gemmatimonadetes bacterium]|jgi:excinuclease ABC subunit C|nr:UvrB/UvrC protein [Gemmatimonadota bacterium]
MRRLSKIRKALSTPKTSDEHIAEMRAHVRASAADRPGVYRWLSPEGEVVYVGKSKKLRTRLLSYFRCAPDEKGARICREATRIEWEYTPSEFAALLEELRLIKRYRPRLNVAMKRDARHFAFIKLTRGAAPKLAVVRGAGADDAQIYYGPFHGAQRVTEAVRELNDALGLRDCRIDQPMHFADQPELFQLMPRTPGCIRHEIRKCLGPCVGGCTAGEYDERVRMVRGFLDGADDAPMDALRAEMVAASELMDFERAAVLRDKLQRLEGLREQFIRFRFAIETLSFVYTVPGHDGDDRVYLIRRGRVRAEFGMPRSEQDRIRILEMVESVFNPSDRDTAQVPSHEVDELLLLSSWFRRFPAELTRSRDARAFVAAPPVLAYDAARDPLFGDAA